MYYYYNRHAMPYRNHLFIKPFVSITINQYSFSVLNHEQDEHMVQSLLIQSILSYNHEIQFH